VFARPGGHTRRANGRLASGWVARSRNGIRYAALQQPEFGLNSSTGTPREAPFHRPATGELHCGAPRSRRAELLPAQAPGVPRCAGSFQPRAAWSGNPGVRGPRARLRCSRSAFGPRRIRALAHVPRRETSSSWPRSRWRGPHARRSVPHNPEMEPSGARTAERLCVGGRRRGR